MHVHQLGPSASTVDSDEFWRTDRRAVAAYTRPRSRRLDDIFVLRTRGDLHTPTLG